MSVPSFQRLGYQREEAEAEEEEEEDSYTAWRSLAGGRAIGD